MREFAVLPGTQARVLPVSLFYGLLAFVASVITLEFWRGMHTRHRAAGEGYLWALNNLVKHNRRRYGGYLIHLGVIMIALGVVGTNFFKVETQRNLAVGESLTIISPFTGSYTLTYEGLTMLPSPEDMRRTGATLTISRDGQRVGQLQPTHDFYIPQEQPMTIPAMRHTVAEDLYVILAGWDEGGIRATFKAYVEPLVNWLWIGGLVFIFGTAVAAWPMRAEERQAVPSALPGQALRA
jgi:cytochrome c-type biogenesis protein CcmF